MTHIIHPLLLAVVLTLLGGATHRTPSIPLPDVASVPYQDPCTSLYKALDLESQVDFSVFQKAYNGYLQIEDRRKNILTLIDFTKPSNTERLFVIDVDAQKILHHTLVAHGKNSGNLYATSFSNNMNSHQSSLGFYLTSETYQGSNGYSLRLEGLEEGINSNARRRAIVIHGARYANPSVCQGGGRLGRSFGCPALPEAINKPIIDVIKEGSVLYIYADDPHYLAESKFASCSTPSSHQS